MALVWITGLAGSGKSTLARSVNAQLQRDNNSASIIDGDAFRRAHVPGLGYSRQDRFRCALALTRHARAQRKHHHVTLVATISLFHDIHALNRELHSPYVEVLLEVRPETLAERLGERQQTDPDGPWVGKEIEPEYPRAPHLILTNDNPADLTRNTATLTAAIKALNDGS